MRDTIKRIREKTNDEGFTLIELLVVVVIIGVLVAIAVPVYLNYRQGAADKSAQSDVRGAISAIEQFYTNNGNAYPADTGPLAAGVQMPLAALAGGTAGKITISAGTTLQLKNVAATTSYIVCATNANGTTGKVYVYNSLNGGSVGASTEATVGACITAGT